MVDFIAMIALLIIMILFGIISFITLFIAIGENKNDTQKTKDNEEQPKCLINYEKLECNNKERLYTFDEVKAFSIIGLSHLLESPNKEDFTLETFENLFIDPLQKVYMNINVIEIANKLKNDLSFNIKSNK